VTVNVYSFYQSDVVPHEVTSCIEKYKKFRTLLQIRKVLLKNVRYDAALIRLLATFLLSVMTFFLLVQMISNPFAGLLLFFSACLYGSLFLRSWEAYSRAVIQGE
jgi:hypothetical protein